MDDSIQWFTTYDQQTDTQTIAVELEFRGDATNFGITFASPSKPDVYDVDQQLFPQLRDITPRRPEDIDIFDGWFTPIAEAQDSGAGVDVVEVKDVGDFTATVLRANSTSALTGWLDDNGYAYTEANVEAFDYYVDKDGFHFIALKINMDEVSCLQNKDQRDLMGLLRRADPPLNAKEGAILVDQGIMDPRSFQERFPDADLDSVDTSSCYIRGKLKPFAVDYTVDQPTLYTRIMGQNAKPMDITLYTAGDVPWYVPGTTVHYSQRVDHKDMNEAPAAEPFLNAGDWLTRSTMTIDFRNVTTDIRLRPGTDALSIGRGDRPRVVNEERVQAGTGVRPDNGYNPLTFTQPADARPDDIARTVFLATSAVQNTLGDLVRGIAPAIIVTLLLPLLVLAALVAEPATALILLPAAALGLLWSRRRALEHTALGTAAAVITVLIGAAVLGAPPGNEVMNSLVAVIGMPAAVAGLLAFTGSSLAARYEAVRKVQRRYDAMNRWQGAATVAAIWVPATAATVVAVDAGRTGAIIIGAALFGAAEYTAVRFWRPRLPADGDRRAHSLSDWRYVAGLLVLLSIFTATLLAANPGVV